MELLKKKLLARGARGILGLGKLFKIMDDDRSGMLSLEEFTKAMKEYKLGIEDSDIQELSRYFDVDHSGQIHYDEFLRAARVSLEVEIKRFCRAK
jgi:Ca2+-binding EF-hand superfamily protein